jgi:adenosylcobinamide-GDP ribazoletransferase
VSLRDGVRLAIGTFTVVPVAAPRTVTAHEAKIAILLGPVIGGLLGGAAVVVLLVVDLAGGGDLLAAALAVSVLALLTRGMHLDGLADVADGLGSGQGRPGALTVMRRPDIGAFGALVLVLVVVLQVAALARAQELGMGTVALVVAVVSGRVAIVGACVRGVPAARLEGLGATVAGSVPAVAAVAWTVVLLGLSAFFGFGWVLVSSGGLVAALMLLVHCVRRFGGITGDVLGAVSETATTAALVLGALAG